MWDARAIIVMVLAVAVSGGYIAGIIGLVIWGKSLSDVGGEVMIALIGALIAIIAAYVGQPTKPKDEDEDHDNGRE